MAQSYYSLEQAAQFLGMTTDELGQMARKGELRSFTDGGSWKFRTQDIEELKRTREIMSEAEFLFEEDASPAELGDDVFLFEDDAPKATDSAVGRSLQANPDSLGSGESDVRLIFSDETSGSESDVRVVPDLPVDDKPPADSDIRLASTDLEESDEDLMLDAVESSGDSGILLPSDDDIDQLVPDEPIAGVPTEEFRVDADEDEPILDLASSSSSGIRLADLDDIEDEDDLVPLTDDDAIHPPAKAGDSGTKKPAAQAEDDFNFDDELGGGFNVQGDADDVDVFDLASATPTAKQAPVDDSDSDFSLSLDDEIGLAQDITPGAGDSGINLARPDDSGILLRKAADSGVNLKSDEDTSDSEFDVALDSDDDLFDSGDMPSFKASDTAPRLAKVDEDSEGISDSDFELAIDEDVEADEESGSEVVALDDEEDESEEYDQEFDEDSPYGGREEGEAVVVIPQAAPWGGLWVAFLSLTSIVFIVIMMMMYEITRNAWSYNQPYPLTATIIQQVYEIGKSMGLSP